MSPALLNAADRVRLGVWVFLASEIMFFGPVFLSYGIARLAFSSGFQEAARSTHLGLGTLNTAVLLTSSATVALAVTLARHGRHDLARRALEGTIFLACLFLVVKGLEYRLEWQENLIPGRGFELHKVTNQRAAELFYSIYFFSTLLHSLHLIIGLTLLAWYRIRYASLCHTHQLEGFALYWHFVDLIWIFLFPLLYLAGRAS